MPRKMFEGQPTPSAPPIFIERSSAKAKPFTTIGSTRQCQSKAESADITSTIGKIEKASVTVAFGLVTVKGVGPPPTNPKTNDVPLAVAVWIASTATLSE